jgi:tyrosyl-tRNA synthetase
LRRFTFLSHEEIGQLEEAALNHPERRAAQEALAGAVCTFVHGSDEKARAERAARALYSEEIAGLAADLLEVLVADAPSSIMGRSVLDGGLPLADAFVTVGLSPSKTAARTAISQGGAYVNNMRRTSGNATVEEPAITRADLLADRYVLLRRGRRDYHVLRFE